MKNQPPSNRSIKGRFIALFVIILGWGLLVFGVSTGDYLNLTMLETHYNEFQSYVEKDYYQTILISAGLFFFVVATAIPGGSVLAIAYGFLFGPWVATLLAVIFGTLGAYLPFLLSRYFFYGAVNRKLGKWITIAEKEFNKNPISYLLAMRLNPAIPLMVQNLVPGALNVSPLIYLATAFFGLIPPSIAFALFGAGLTNFLESGNAILTSNILSYEFIVGLFLISILMLAFPLLNYFKTKR